ncbi:hypothetical protein PMEGAPR236_03480 [Priestia megaterium]
MSQLLFNITLIISFMFAASIVREQIIYRVEGINRYKIPVQNVSLNLLRMFLRPIRQHFNDIYN